jgi:hypothetical protein
MWTEVTPAPGVVWKPAFPLRWGANSYLVWGAGNFIEWSPSSVVWTQVS